ncbi:MAG: 3-deoxy-7-phosphoheptulonate synthase [Actinobacteria bacterium]|nr:3-deoxy-7-phosphoheptulonate synthase [Actinomycetota bacterium]
MTAQLETLFDKSLKAAQQPEWPDISKLEAAVKELKALPPLVFAGECDNLKAKIAQAARGEAFWLQGGDCAETFAGATADSIRNRIKTILQMAAVLQYGASMPVIKVGRMAGQFAKPRSNNIEKRGDIELPAYRGDAVNDLEFTESARTPDPARLVKVYHNSSATLNLVRAFTKGGFADLRLVHEWNKGFVKDSNTGMRYEALAKEIGRALDFMRSAGINPEEFKTVDFYSSHEALILEYEKALTRIDSRTGLPYDVSAHFLWIGERTRQLDGAHIDFAKKIKNPIGVKLGPKTSVEEMMSLIKILNPDDEPGRDDVLDEVRGFFEVHHAKGTHPGGIHIELTGDDVTECVGGGAEISHEDLATRYETACDPRLNHTQSLELAFLLAEMLRDRK